MAGDEDKMEVEPVADDDAAAKKLAAKAAKGPKKALPAPRFEIKKWNVSSRHDKYVFIGGLCEEELRGDIFARYIVAFSSIL